MPKKHARAGQPTKYRTQFCKPARALCERGATDAELATYFEVSIDTISEWKKLHKEFSAATKNGKQFADNNVEKALYERAVGYKHPDTHFSTYEGIVIPTPTTKHYPPDATSMIFWLKNRKPKEWRDRQEQVVLNPDGSNLIPQSIIDAAAKIAKGL